MTNKRNILFLVCIVLSFVAYIGIGYYVTRENAILLFTSIGVLFGVYFYLISKPVLLRDNFKSLMYIGFIFRLAFLFSVPSLSDDFYRFIWDGRLIENGINPFSYRPDFIMEKGWLNGNENLSLYTNMNSPHYYSIYPGVLQLIFFISAKLSVSNFYSVVLLRAFIIVAEFGTFFYLKKILASLHLPKEKLFIYFMNPLVIIELSGNLHFEAVMLFFMSASIYYFIRHKLMLSAIAFALAVSTKLIPLLLLPLIVRKVGFKKGLIYSSIVILISIAMFTPFISLEFLTNISDSVGLYFQKFEFNASTYYLLRGIGFYFTGYNTIGLIGRALPIITFLSVIYLSFKFKRDTDEIVMFSAMLNILFIYYIFALIIHPWYISFLLLINVFVNKKFIIVWSLMIFTTYFTYSIKPYQESLLMVALEYVVVFAILLFETLRLNGIHIFNKNS